VKLSRNTFFYKDLGLKDSFETRIILIFIHFSIILIRFRKKSPNKFPQDTFDNIFHNIEYHLREMGIGDVGVNKKMKLLNKIFYDILLKIDGDIQTKNKIKMNPEVINKHLLSDYRQKDDILRKINSYFDGFSNFCFELDDKTMIKGDIKYKD
tara:strand:- start:58 stop:516 length:459 start_codon:yes stop_codon:yes gene_type:complete